MSSSDMPELGSKISLISKADIRYEGKLYTVDPQDCTIALANVRSFGTEDRKTSHPVPPQNQIYDYILFRATDIKDISVVPPTQLLYDPAIVQLSAPSAMNSSRSGFGASSTAGSASSEYHPLGGMSSSAPGGPMSQFSGFNPMQSNITLARPSPSEFLHHQTNSELLSGSRSSTPGLRRSSPTVDQGTQANNRKSPQKDDASRQRNRSGSRNQQDRSGTRSRNDSHNDQVQRSMQQHQHHQQQQQQTYQQQSFQQHRGRPNYQQQQPQQQQGGQRMNHQFQQHQGPRNQMRQHHQQGQHQQGGDRWNRPRNQHQQGQGGQRQNFQRAPGARAKPTPLKFESDYDFDKANNEFEELRNELSKIKLDAPAPLPIANGDEKKDDSGNETCADALEQNEGEAYFYNKTKSFFDNISCEAIERSKGRIQRTDWRKERKLNSETFGVSSARRGMYYGRGGMRGGYGYHYGRGGYGYNRGGFRQPMMYNRQRSQPRQQNHNLNQPQVANA